MAYREARPVEFVLGPSGKVMRHDRRIKQNVRFHAGLHASLHTPWAIRGFFIDWQPFVLYEHHGPYRALSFVK
jgi:hypothetical protein